MAKFKPLNENQLVMLPISLQNQLVPGTAVSSVTILMFIFDMAIDAIEYGEI
jgi:hypothetical protein